MTNKKLTPAAVQAATAKYLATLAARPDGLTKLVDLLAGIRASADLSPGQRAKLTRQHVTAALFAMGIPMGVHDKTYHLIGYAIDAPPALIVDDAGKIRDAA